MSVSRKKGGSSIHFMNPFIVEVDGGGIKQVPAVPNFSSEGSAFLMESVNLDRISESPKAFPVCVRSASRLFFVLRLKLHSIHRAVFQYVYDVSESASVCHPLPSVFTQRQVRLIQSQEILRVAVAEHGSERTRIGAVSQISDCAGVPQIAEANPVKPAGCDDLSVIAVDFTARIRFQGSPVQEQSR